MLAAAASSMARRTDAMADPRCGVNTVRSRKASRAGGIRRGRSGPGGVLHSDHVGGVAPQPSGAQRRRDGRLVHDGSAPHVHQERSPLHAGQGTGVQEVERLPVERGREDDVIGGREEVRQPGAARPRVLRCFRVREDHPRPERRYTSRDGPAHGAEPDQSDRAPLQPGPVQDRPPPHPAGRPHAPVPLEDPPGQRQEQGDRQVRRGSGQEVGDDAHPHAAPRAGFHVDVVTPLERAGDDEQPRTAPQELRVHPVRHEDEDRVRLPRAGPQGLPRERLPRVVEEDARPSRERLRHRGVDPVGDHHHGTTPTRRDPALPRHWNRRRTAELSTSTRETQARTTRRSAVTSRYAMRLRAAWSSNPIPPQPTIPITVEARKLNSHR